MRFPRERIEACLHGIVLGSHPGLAIEAGVREGGRPPGERGWYLHEPPEHKVCVELVHQLELQPDCEKRLQPAPGPAICKARELGIPGSPNRP
jgi:hypothetical protein